MKLWVKDKLKTLSLKISKLQKIVIRKAEKHIETIMRVLPLKMRNQFRLLTI